MVDSPPRSALPSRAHVAPLSRDRYTRAWLPAHRETTHVAPETAMDSVESSVTPGPSPALRHVSPLSWLMASVRT